MSADQASVNFPFWRFSVTFYRQEDVAAACLELQDRDVVDVNLLLFLLWLASTRRQIAVDEVRALDARLNGWRAEVVAPLRQMRRRLKADAPLVAPARAQAFRERVKALELEAERLQQEAMQGMADALATVPAPAVADAARANVAAYEQARGSAFSPRPVEVLLAALAHS